VLTDNRQPDQSKGPPQVGNERFLKSTDVSDILNISASQTYALVRTVDLKGIQIGGGTSGGWNAPHSRNTSPRPTGSQRSR